MVETGSELAASCQHLSPGKSIVCIKYNDVADDTCDILHTFQCGSVDGTGLTVWETSTSKSWQDMANSQFEHPYDGLGRCYDSMKELATDPGVLPTSPSRNLDERDLIRMSTLLVSERKCYGARFEHLAATDVWKAAVITFINRPWSCSTEPMFLYSELNSLSSDLYQPALTFTRDGQKLFIPGDKTGMYQKVSADLAAKTLRVGLGGPPYILLETLISLFSCL